jgi:hypothetical protein
MTIYYSLLVSFTDIAGWFRVKLILIVLIAPSEGKKWRGIHFRPILFIL